MRELPQLFKVKKTRYISPEGKRCKKTDPGATAEVKLSTFWYADVPIVETPSQRLARKAEGKNAPKPERVRFTRNKRASQKMLADLIESRERQAAGLRDYQAFTSQLLIDLLDQYESHLRTAKTAGDDYINLSISRIKLVLNGCGFIHLSDLDSVQVSCWLSTLREVGKNPTKHKVTGHADTYAKIASAFNVSPHTVSYWRSKGAPIVPKVSNNLAKIAAWVNDRSAKRISASTSDHYVTALKAFGSWMVKPGKKAESNPFKDLEKLNDISDIRKRRRALTTEDFAQLTRATHNSKRMFRGLDGQTRSILYIFAAYTGLRASEIASLTTDSISFGSPSIVTVLAGYTKNSEVAELPIRDDLAEAMRRHIQSLRPNTLNISGDPLKLWPGTWLDSGAEMLRADLEEAALPYTDNQGRDYDFHALRHQFITSLSRAGVSLRAAQELARHSKPELTANIYTHLSVHDTASDVQKLPAIPTGDSAQLANTGTDNQSLGQCVGQWKMLSGVTQSDIGKTAGTAIEGQEMKKSPEKPVFSELSESDADGTRTRNHRIDSPVL